MVTTNSKNLKNGNIDFKLSVTKIEKDLLVRGALTI